MELTVNRPACKTRGFTLIELMVVVAILAILSTLLIVGIGKLQTNAKRQQTAQLLENCRAMWAEYDSVKRLHIDPFVTYCPGDVTPGGVDQLGLETFLTQSMFSLMRSQPNIKAATDKYSAGKLLIPVSTVSPYGNINPTGYISGNFYPPGVNVPGQSQSAFCEYQNPIADSVTGIQYSEMYLCIHQPVNTSGMVGTPPSPPDTGYWLPVAGLGSGGIGSTPNIDTTTPVFLDAWGNPIICVIGGELGTKTALAAGPVPYGALVVNGTYSNGTVTNPTQAQSIQITSPDQRLFFASAGPDGNFSKGDDNIYSFQK
jgi:prepilin-type N-terminal cleavage/methylation domain-containing protein